MSLLFLLFLMSLLFRLRKLRASLFQLLACKNSLACRLPNSQFIIIIYNVNKIFFNSLLIPLMIHWLLHFLNFNNILSNILPYPPRELSCYFFFIVTFHTGSLQILHTSSHINFPSRDTDPEVYTINVDTDLGASHWHPNKRFKVSWINHYLSMSSLSLKPDFLGFKTGNLTFTSNPRLLN